MKRGIDDITKIAFKSNSKGVEEDDGSSSDIDAYEAKSKDSKPAKDLATLERMQQRLEWLTQNPQGLYLQVQQLGAAQAPGPEVRAGKKQRGGW